MAIVRGTTPTIIFSFKEITVSTITEAFLVVKQWDAAKITKDLDAGTVDSVAKTVSWKLTQSETLGLDQTKQAVITCDWLLTDGTRGRSVAKTECVENSGKDSVISA